MMVSRTYLTGRKKRPGPISTWFMQDVLPIAIDGLGAVEQGAWRARERTRHSPVATLCGALACGFLLRRLIARRA